MTERMMTDQTMLMVEMVSRASKMSLLVRLPPTTIDTIKVAIAMDDESTIARNTPEISLGVMNS